MAGQIAAAFKWLGDRLGGGGTVGIGGRDRGATSIMEGDRSPVHLVEGDMRSDEKGSPPLPRPGGSPAPTTDHFVSFQFLLPPELRRPLAARAIAEEVPLDELVVRILEEAVGRRKAAAPKGDG